jgi:hypothetical protein
MEKQTTMKRLLTFFAFLMSVSLMQAQITTPAPSPACTTEQKVGLTDVKIEYSRPGAKGRTIFGDLVPYGQMWRTGANASAKISFSTDVMINDQDVPKGTYALYTIPGETNWTIILYKDLSHWGVPQEWKAEDEAVRFDVPANNEADMVENFHIYVDGLTNSGGNIVLAWENTQVHFGVAVPTDKAVMASIEKTMAGPSDRDYYLAASYYQEEGKDLNKALSWVDMALQKGGDKFWVLRRKALIQADLKDYKGAIATAKKSIEEAKKAGNMDYVKSNEASIKEWMKM